MLSHAATKAMRSGRFPADDALDERAVAATQAWNPHMALPAQAAVFVSPAACTRASAELLGLNAQIAPLLAEIDHGRWRGERLADIAAAEPEALAAWIRDPDMASHGGESFSAALKRVGAWLDGLNRNANVIVISHASIMRAAIIHALDVAPTTFSHIEIAPLSVVQLRRSARGWIWLPGQA